MAPRHVRQVWHESGEPPVSGMEILHRLKGRWSGDAWAPIGRALVRQTALAVLVVLFAAGLVLLPGDPGLDAVRALRWGVTADYGYRAAGRDLWVMGANYGPGLRLVVGRWGLMAWDWARQRLTRPVRDVAPTATVPPPAASASPPAAPPPPSVPLAPSPPAPAPAAVGPSAHPVYITLDRPDAAPMAKSDSESPGATLSGRVLSPFGWRTTAGLGTELHEGIDVEQAVGTPVRSLRSGTVAAVSEDFRMGVVVQVNSAGGLTIRYAPLTAVAVRPGAPVSAGAVLGRLAAAPPAEPGTAHLHLETLVGGQPVDPEPTLGLGQS